MNSLNIMCLGDSITEGATVDGAYRNRLCELIENDGLSEVVHFIGDRSNGTGYDKNHSGHSAYSIADIPAADDCEGKGRNGITDEIGMYAGDNKLDIVLLQIGTNDVLSLYKLDTAKVRLVNLIDNVQAVLSENGRIYLATIPYISESSCNKTGKNQQELDTIIDTYNNDVREVSSMYQNIEIADINSLLEFSDLQDGIHPNKAGYNKMGDFWYATIKNCISELLSVK